MRLHFAWLALAALVVAFTPQQQSVEARSAASMASTRRSVVFPKIQRPTLREFLSPVLATVTGRYKVAGDECYWDSSDSGPNQCWPASGRWKVGGAGCYWDANDGGPHQCVPDEPLAEPTEEMDIPEPGEEENYDVDFGAVLGADESSPPPVSCRSHTKNGSHGYIAIQTHPVTGHLAYQAKMHNWYYDFGWWWVSTAINGVPSNPKSQPYPPHDSFSPSQVVPGSLFQIVVGHIFPVLFINWELEWIDGSLRYVPRPAWGYGWAYGWTQCVVPAPI